MKQQEPRSKPVAVLSPLAIAAVCCFVTLIIILVSWVIYQLTVAGLTGGSQPDTIELGVQEIQSAFIRGGVIAVIAGLLLVVVIPLLWRSAISRLTGSKDKFESLVAHTFLNAPIGIAICTPTGEVIQPNRSLIRNLNSKPLLTDIRQLAEIIHPEDRTQWLAGLEQVIAGNQNHFELVVRTTGPGQPAAWVRSVINMVNDPGQPPYLIIEIMDITELKEAQADLHHSNLKLESRIEQRTRELKQSEERLQVAIHGAEIGMWEWDVASGDVVYSRGWVKILGYDSPSDLSHIDTWRSLVHPDDAERTFSLLEDNLQGRVPLYKCEYRLKDNTGNWVWIQARGKVTRRGEDGAPLTQCGAMILITERKQIEAELELHREQLEALVRERTEQLEHSELEMRRLFTAMMAGFALHEIICDETGKPVDYRFIFINPEFQRLTGLKAENIIGRTIKEVLPKTEHYWIEHYGRVALTGEPRRFEQYSSELGKYYEVSTYQPNPGQFACVIQDVTDRKLIEREKEITARLYIMSHGTDSPQKLAQQFLELLQELTDCQAIGLRLREGDDFPYFTVCGFPAEFNSRESKLCDNGRTGVMGQIDQANPLLGCICRRVLNGEIDSALPCFTERGSFWTNSVSKLLTELTDDNQTLPHKRCTLSLYESVALIPMISGGENFGLLQFCDRNKGQFSARRIQVLEQIAEVIANIIARRRAEEALVESKHELQVLISIADILLRYPDDEMYAKVLDIVLSELDSEFGFFAYINSEGYMVAPSMTTRIYDQCQIPGKNIEFPPEVWGGIWGQALQEHRTCIKNSGLSAPEGHIPLDSGMSTPIIHRDQVIGELTVGNRPGGYGEQEQAVLEHIAVFLAPVLAARLKAQRDEAEHRRLEAQLRQSQKLEAIGTLAGGIAHDFNNMLYAMLGNLSLARTSLNEDHEACEFLAEADTAGHRAAELVKQILTFARKADKQRGPVHIASIIKEITKLLRSTTPTTIEIKFTMDAERSTINADPIEIHQVIMNLCANAAQAMQESGGILGIEITDRLAAGECPVNVPHPLRIRISDTGPGIPPQVLVHIFEPFFTTKAQGEGTGMGLAVVHGIIQDLDGTITVSSEPKRGTTFEIFLPLMDEHYLDEITSEDAKRLPRGTEHILVVDDEPSITAMIRNTLKMLGYECTAFTSSLDALGAFKAAPGLYDAVITDQTMPEMTGGELATELLKLQPTLPILLCTGYSQTLPGEKARQLGIAAYLTKPMAVADITTTLRAVLDSRRD